MSFNTIAKEARPTARQRANELTSQRAGPLPVWIRAPITGPEFFSGLTRPKLYELAGKNYIRTVTLREPGQKNGVRLFHLQSVLDFIEGKSVNGSQLKEVAQ